MLEGSCVTNLYLINIQVKVDKLCMIRLESETNTKRNKLLQFKIIQNRTSSLLLTMLVSW